MKTSIFVKKWGHSLGLVIPNQIVKIENIKPEDEVIVDITKRQDIMKLFGSLKLKNSAQQMKDEFRREESKAMERKWKQLNKK